MNIETKINNKNNNYSQHNVWCSLTNILFILSCKSRISMVIFSAQGEPFLRPNPYPDRPKSSPTVTRLQSCEASNSSRELSHIKACKVLFNKRKLWINLISTLIIIQVCFKFNSPKFFKVLRSI